MYIPAGWPHVVINLSLSVAVTHNYAPARFAGEIWRALREGGEDEFAERWYAGLQERGRGDLLDVIDETGV